MKCLVCNRILGKHRKKYCTDTCQDFFHSLKAKEKRKNARPLLSKISCIYCTTKFQPLNYRHKCCSITCRNLVENQRAKDCRKKYKNQKRLLETQDVPSLPLVKSDFSSQIEDFKKNGGRIKVFPPQCNGKTPDVTITSLSGWSVETLFGFGYEIQLMEELNDVS